jgi:hypothetical protein
MRSPIRSRRAFLRSAAAWSTISRTAWWTTTTARPAPTISAASTAPSRTRCGSRASRTLSFALAGSPSVPLAITTARRRPAATAASFRAVGKLAPPRPVSPARATSVISASRRRGAATIAEGVLPARAVPAASGRGAHPDADPGGRLDFAYDGTSNVVDQYVTYLRRKIDVPFGRHDIETVRGMGYRLRHEEPG